MASTNAQLIGRIIGKKRQQPTNVWDPNGGEVQAMGIPPGPQVPYAPPVPAQPAPTSPVTAALAARPGGPVAAPASPQVVGGQPHPGYGIPLTYGQQPQSPVATALTSGSAGGFQAPEPFTPYAGSAAAHSAAEAKSAAYLRNPGAWTPLQPGQTLGGVRAQAGPGQVAQYSPSRGYRIADAAQLDYGESDRVSMRTMLQGGATPEQVLAAFPDNPEAASNLHLAAQSLQSTHPGLADQTRPGSGMAGPAVPYIGGSGVQPGGGGGPTAWSPAVQALLQQFQGNGAGAPPGGGAPPAPPPAPSPGLGAAAGALPGGAGPQGNPQLQAALERAVANGDLPPGLDIQTNPALQALLTQMANEQPTALPGTSQSLQDTLAGQMAGTGFETPTLTAQTDPALKAKADALLAGQGVPQADTTNTGAVDSDLTRILKERMQGIGVGPSFEDVVSGSFNPAAAQIDRQFETARSQAFEDLISRGVLSGGEAANKIADLALQQGTSKAQIFGQMALEYAKERQTNINSAIAQYGILEGNRASLKATLTGQNLAAAVSVQNTALSTLENLNKAMIAAETQLQTQGMQTRGQVQSAAASTLAGLEGEQLRAKVSELASTRQARSQALETLSGNDRAQLAARLQDLISRRDITSTEKVAAQRMLTDLESARMQIGSSERIAGAELGSRERIAGQQVAVQREGIQAQTSIAGMDNATRMALGQAQNATQLQVANISAQAALQAANFDRDIAMQNINSRMSLEGVDWNRYTSDPNYQQSIIQAAAMRKDIETAINQATGVNVATAPLERAGA